MATPRRRKTAPTRLSSRSTIPVLARRLRGAPRLVLLLDYDGTLVPFADAPDLARPDEELFTLLWALGQRPNTEVHLVTGRPRETVDRWFSGLTRSLWAEHGLWHRPSPTRAWRRTQKVDRTWMDGVRSILEAYVETTPGTSIEEKDASLVWHYRQADPHDAARMARAVRRTLEEALRGQPVDVLPGNKVMEVRPRGVNKAGVVHRILARESPDAVVVAIGDDHTDEDMFGALPVSGVSLQVGRRRTGAKYRLPNWRAVRAFLRMLIK